MGKKKASDSLGKSIIRNRFKKTKNRSKEDWLHSSELNDGSDWNRINLKSVTEQSSLDEFLATAELAGTEFQAEKLNVHFVTPQLQDGILTKDQVQQIEAAQKDNRHLLRIPRRPTWNVEDGAEIVQKNERDAFANWRQQLGELQDKEHIVLTPYEKNLEVWRQLWRVIERSDIVVQIVDARNPMLFRCEDVETYAKEVSPHKMTLLLVNKADLLTSLQRKKWAQYFQDNGIKAVFWSAAQENHVLEMKAIREEESDEGDDERESSEEDSPQEEEATSAAPLEKEPIEDERWKILDREELIQLFRQLHQGTKVTEGMTTVGLVGFPNVGKSSTVNALYQEKKAAVSSTPGKTKHFQTLILDGHLMLCDCPGLVFPTFVFSRSELVVNGILPIDENRDHVAPVGLVCQRIPRTVIEENYGIRLPLPQEGEDPHRDPYAHEFLDAYGSMRGFMTARGQPDGPRGSRYILKDYVQGRLLFCHPPPGLDEKEFQEDEEDEVEEVTEQVQNTNISDTLDEGFFRERNVNAHSRPPSGPSEQARHPTASSLHEAAGDKSWKKHHNRNKKGKLRRAFAHLDS